MTRDAKDTYYCSRRRGYGYPPSASSSSAETRVCHGASCIMEYETRKRRGDLFRHIIVAKRSSISGYGPQHDPVGEYRELTMSGGAPTQQNVRVSGLVPMVKIY